MKRREGGLESSCLDESELKRLGAELLRLADEAGTPIVIMPHKNADPDAVAAAAAVKYLLKSSGYDARIVLPEGLSQASKRVIREVMGIDPGEFEDETPDESALAVVVDTASLEQLGSLAGFAERVWLVILDHHSSNQLLEKAKLAIYDVCAKAAAELAYLLLRGLGVEPAKELMELLLAGIVYDTRHFILSSPRTLRVAAELMEKGASLEKVLSALQSPPMEMPERIARIKAAKRMHAIRAGGFIAAVTHVGAYESSAARAILDLGADLVLVVSERGGEARLVGRARKGVVEKLGIHLGKDIMEPVARELGGGGGGHAQAAGATVKSSVERAIAKLVERLETLFKARGLQPQPIT